MEMKSFFEFCGLGMAVAGIGFLVLVNVALWYGFVSTIVGIIK